jgi:hypothetical protein
VRTLAAVLPLLAACGSAELTAPGEPLDPPGPAEAKVIVFRPADRNALRAYAFFDAMELVGFLESEGRIEYLCGEGGHLFYLRGVTDAAVRADLEGGKTYILRVSSEPRWLRLELLLVPADRSDEAALEREVAACRLSERRLERAEEYLGEHWEAVSERLAWYAGEGGTECAVLKREDGR